MPESEAAQLMRDVFSAHQLGEATLLVERFPEDEQVSAAVILVNAVKKGEFSVAILGLLRIALNN